MKKYIIAAGVALLGLSSVNAQDINFGIKAGVNLANMMGDDIENNSMKIGAFGGVYANMSLTDDIFFQPELLYSMQGAEFEGDTDGKITLDYLNIPLMFQYGVTENIRVELGPQVGILLTSETEIEDITVDTKDDTKSIDFGVNAGGSYYMENGLSFTLRYSLGLTTFSEVEEADMKNAVLSVGVGYSL